MAETAKGTKVAAAQASRIRQDEDVQKALKEAAPEAVETKPARRAVGLVWLVGSGIATLVLAGFYLALEQGVVSLPGTRFNLFHRLPLVALLVSGLVFLDRVVEQIGIVRLESPVSRYNLTRVVRLVFALAIVGALGAVLFGNLYTGLVSLGVISIVVGLAVQTPMTSFIGWVYILIRQPYRVGDRIQIGSATGDVIEVSYLDTKLWEFGGKYLSTDHPSGRIIQFPNSNVLNTPVYNYSWPLFPYVWNEIKFQIGYESDLEFVADTMQRVAEKEIGKEMVERVHVYRDLLAKTPVDELSVQEKPTVLFRPSENTWLEAILRYLVDPKRAGRTKTRLVVALLEALNAEPEKVLFPKGPNR
jgi:small-conductance mechanosensitive channel